MRKLQLQAIRSVTRRAPARIVALAVTVGLVVRRAVRALVRGALRPVATYLATQWVRTLSLDELQQLVLQARAGGSLDARDASLLNGVFEFHAKRADDVMRPRTEIVALPIDATETEVRAALSTERYSRYPVFREGLDDVVGIFLAKDLLLHQTGAAFSLQHYTRSALYVPATRRAELVLDDLRRSRAHMAIVLDEYGGTAGIVTMEDLVEQVIGEIADEYDPATRTSLESDGVLELAGTLSLIDVRSAYDLAIPEGDWTTIGGYAFGKLGRVPRIGDRVGFPGGELEVIAVDGRRLAALRVHRARVKTENGALSPSVESPVGDKAPRRSLVGDKPIATPPKNPLSPPRRPASGVARRP
jgi:CBS domain containing-hemolysin-like protein